MLFKRRDFLKLAGMATVFAVADPAALATISGDVYRNERLSLTMQRPRGWHFLSTVDYVAASKHQLLLEDSPQIRQMLTAPEAMPFVMMTKFDADHPDLNPCIAGWDEPIEPDVAESELDYHEAALAAWERFLPGFCLHDGPYDIRINGTPVTKSEWMYSFEHDSGRSWQVSVRTILVFRADRTHTFHFIDGEGADASRELEAAEGAIRYGASFAS